LSLDELRNHSGQPPLSGEVKLEGTVANIDFLNAFLARVTPSSSVVAAACKRTCA
jgi:hypothetical protein